MGLKRYNGGLLRYNGKLAGEHCPCCDDPYNPCPPCCTKMEGGTFNEDGDLVFETSNQYGTWTVVAEMPTKDSRLICAEDPVNFIATLDWTAGNQPTEFNYRGHWDLAWIYESATPAPDHEYEYGMVEWNDVIEEEVELGLTYNHCVVGPNKPQLGDVTLSNQESGLSITITLANCDIEADTLCCGEEHECENCCGFVDENEWYVHNDKFVKFAEYDGWLIVLVIEEGPTPAENLWCPPDTIKLIWKVVPPSQQAHDDWGGVATGNQEGWLPPIDECSSSFDPGSKPDFEFEGRPTCSCFFPGEVSVTFTMPDDEEISVSFDLNACPEDPNCPCCCPPTCCVDCHFPVNPEVVCDPSYPGSVVGGWTQITDLYIEQTQDGDDWVVFEQDGPSTHFVLCVNECAPNGTLFCAVSRCFFNVPMKVSGPGRPGGPGYFTLRVQYQPHPDIDDSGQWKMAAGGVSFSPWNGVGPGPHRPPGGCDGASYATNYTINGKTYANDGSFTVVRENPDDSPCPTEPEEA
jgi:hypothetical protein